MAIGSSWMVTFGVILVHLATMLQAVHKRGKVEDIFKHIEAVKLDTKSFQYLQETDFAIMFFYKGSQIEADYIRELVVSVTQKISHLFPRMRVDIIDADEEYEVSYHYDIAMRCKLFVKFEDTTTVEYPSHIFREQSLIQWIFEVVRRQTRKKAGFVGVIESSLQDIATLNEKDADRLQAEQIDKYFENVVI